MTENNSDRNSVENGTRLAFVTGASRGIGRAIAERLIADNYKVGVGYFSNEGLAMEVVNSHDNALPIQVDVSERSDILRAAKLARDFFAQPISILVNNAAVAQEKHFLEITDDDWDRMMAINLRSNFAFSQAVIPAMAKRGWGRIINISSIGGQWGGLNQVHYAAAKAAQINFTRSLAKLYSGEGVTANVIAIGLADTDMAAHELNTEAGKAKVSGIPAGRLAAVEEIAGTAAFLASNEAAYITGQTINLNGGMYFV